MCHYTFISTVSVYDYPGASDENSKLAPYTDPTDPYSFIFQGSQSGPLKALCEREAQQEFAGRVLVFAARPHRWTAREGGGLLRDRGCSEGHVSRIMSVARAALPCLRW